MGARGAGPARGRAIRHPRPAAVRHASTRTKSTGWARQRHGRRQPAVAALDAVLRLPGRPTTPSIARPARSRSPTATRTTTPASTRAGSAARTRRTATSGRCRLIVEALTATDPDEVAAFSAIHRRLRRRRSSPARVVQRRLARGVHARRLRVAERALRRTRPPQAREARDRRGEPRRRVTGQPARPLTRWRPAKGGECSVRRAARRIAARHDPSRSRRRQDRRRRGRRCRRRIRRRAAPRASS